MEFQKRCSGTSPMKRLSWKYIAGLIDGEGCLDVYIINNRWIGPRIRMTMAVAGKQVIQALHFYFGGYYFEKPSTNPNWSDKCGWELHGYAPVCKFLRNVTNHLTIKKEQARFLMWMETTLKGKRIDGNPNMDSVRQIVRDELAAMKHDPHRLSEMAQARLIPLL